MPNAAANERHDLQFLWSSYLPLLVIVPVLIFGYVRALRRRSRFALRYSSLAVAVQAVEKKQGRRRHAPALFLFSAMSFLLLALARPYVMVPVAKQQKTVILAVDTSASMMNADVQPTRLEAAKEAARAFVLQQDPTVYIGVVAFSDSATVVQAPSADRTAVVAAIERLNIDSSTAIGSGILASLKAILEANGYNVDIQVDSGLVSSDVPDVRLPAAMVLLTDGQNVIGPSPIDAAQKAAHYGVAIYTVGIGTTDRSIGADQQLDEGTLNSVATATHARYFRALDEQSLTSIYENLHVHLTVSLERIEIAPPLAALAAALVLLSAALSFFWSSALP